MSTSLAEQLKRLATPQTSLFKHSKKEASLLFDPSEAASYDRQHIYDIALSGFVELRSINANFAEFEDSLFGQTSISFERSVQTKKDNDVLNKHIRKFLHLLSPYFLLKSSLKALEWLIRRYHIHLYNMDDLVMLAIQYHETLTFVRVIQVLNISDKQSPWHWLKPIQKHGVPLSKTVLLNHCASRPAFLKLLCDTTLDAIEAHGSGGVSLSTLIAFYCTTVIGSLEHSKSNILELQITHLFEALIKGYASVNVDFVAASYMITAELVMKASLSTKLLERLVRRIIKKLQHPGLLSDSILVLIVLYQNQEHSIKELPVSATLQLAENRNFPAVLGEIANGYRVTPLLLPIIKQALVLIQSQEESCESMKTLVEQLLSEVKLDEDDADAVVRAVIDGYQSPDVMPNGMPGEDIMEWYASLVKRLERSYPTVFDAAVCRTLKGEGISEQRAQDLKEMLGFELSLDLLDKLRHPKAQIRVLAARKLAKKCSTFTEKDLQALQGSLENFLIDDDPNVVLSALCFTPSVLENALGIGNLRKALIEMLKRCAVSTDISEWSKVMGSAVKVLCDLKFENGAEELETLLALLPLLNQEIVIDNIYDSKFVRQCQLLNRVIKIMGARDFQLAVPALVWSVTQGIGLVKADDVFHVAQLVKERSFDDARWFVDRLYTALLLAASVPRQADPALALKLLAENDSLLGTKQLVCPENEVDLTPSSLAAALNTCREHALPIQCSFHVLSVIISRLDKRKHKQRKWFDVQDDSEYSKLLIEVFRKILAGCVHPNKVVSSAYVNLMKLFFKEHSPAVQHQVAFLCSISTFPEVSVKAEHLELSIRCLRLTQTLLLGHAKCREKILENHSDSNVVPAIVIALQYSSATVRQVACDSMEILLSTKNKVPTSQFRALLKELLSRKEEILVDEKQLQLVLRNIFVPTGAFQPKQELMLILSDLLKCVLAETTPTHVVAGLLRSLTFVNSPKIFQLLLPLVHRSLAIGRTSEEPNRFCSEILQNVLGRLDASTSGSLENPDSWATIEAAFRDQKTPILSPEGEIIRPAVVICKRIDQNVWKALSYSTQPLQGKVLTLLVETASTAECPEVISAVSSVFRCISLDAATCLRVLHKMKEIQVQEPEAKSLRKPSAARRSIHKPPSALILQTVDWHRGMALLEFLQIKKKLTNVHLLIPILFDLLKRCLDFEEQAPVEYAKQVLLSCILSCCNKLAQQESQQTKAPTTKSVINVELVVQCIRASQNPQTHHHALLVLTHLANIVPDQVLHNIMAIFTFMGSLVLRQDDSYSFQVTSKILETIIPVLVKSSDANNEGKLEETVASVMRVFVDALLDVPEHRRLGLFRKLLSTLDANRFLWLFLCLVFESHVVNPRPETSEPKRKGTHSLQSEVPKRLEVALQLVHEFPLETIFVNCVSLLQYVRMLPLEKDEKPGRRPRVAEGLAKYNVATLFNVEQNSPKVLRHYKYTIVTFLSALLSSKPLAEKVASLDKKSNSFSTTDENLVETLDPLYHSFLAALLSFIQVLNNQVNTSKSPQSAKYWSVMLGQTCDILEKINALLPSKMFLNVISGLLVHNIQLLRRKALDLLNNRLTAQGDIHQEPFILTCDIDSLLNLLKPLVDIVSSIEVTQNGNVDSDDDMEEDRKLVPKSNAKDDVLLTQQTALYSIKILARQLAYDHRDKFTPILEMVTNLLKKRTSLNDNILACLILCCAELCSALKAHAIGALPALVPSIIEILSEFTSNLQDAPHVVLLTVVSAVLRVVDTLPNFLSPYLKELLEKTCTLLALSSKKVSEEGEGCKLMPVAVKLTAAGQKMSTSISPRVLVPAVSQCYNVLKSDGQIGVGPLMTILSDSFAGLNPVDLRNLLTDLTDFFLNALNYRDERASENSDEVETVEGHIIKAWVSLVLKLSETSFKPLYYKLYDWATRLDSHKDRVITFYRLSFSVSDCLKGLFPSYSGYFLKNAAMLLDHCNVTKVGEPDETEFNDQDEDRPAELYFGSGEIAEKKCASLVEHILNTFKNVFLYDSQDYVNKETFEGLVRPIIDQLENTVGGMDCLKSRADKVLIPCIAQFAVALDDDIVWKHINYQILLKTKHKNPQIRLLSLEAVCKVVHKLGDSFLPLIPETMPFLAELLEDEDENVENACRHAVQDLEQVLGEPLQKYF